MAAKESRSRTVSPAKSVSPSKKRNSKAGKRGPNQPPPTAGSGTSGESVASLKLGADFENMNGTSSSAATSRTDAGSTNSSETGTGSTATFRISSPTKSPRKKIRARDVLQLPKPYDNVKSDIIKKWLKEIDAGNPIDEEAHPTYSQLRFCNALIQKVNQLSKQVSSEVKHLEYT